MKKIFVLLLISVLALNFVRPGNVVLAQEEGDGGEEETAPGEGNSVGQENPPGEEETPPATTPPGGQEQPSPEGEIILTDEAKAALISIVVGIVVVGFVLLIKRGGV